MNSSFITSKPGFSILIHVSCNEIFECLLVMVVGIISHLSGINKGSEDIYSRVSVS